MMAKPVLEDAWNNLQHDKGFFVMCRLMNLPGATGEIAAFLKLMTPHVPALLRDHKRGGQIHKAAWRLVRPAIWLQELAYAQEWRRWHRTRAPRAQGSLGICSCDHQKSIELPHTMNGRR